MKENDHPQHNLETVLMFDFPGISPLTEKGINKKMCTGIIRKFKGKTVLSESNSPVYSKVNNQIPSILEYELSISLVNKVYKPELMPETKGTFSFCNKPQGDQKLLEGLTL